MAFNQRTPTVCALVVLFLSLHTHSVLSSSDPPASSPTAATAHGSHSPSPAISLPPSNPPESPSPASGISSPPSPPPPQSPSPSPSQSQSQSPESDDNPSKSPSPSPTRSAAADESPEVANIHEQKESSTGGGISGGKKAGVVLGVLVGACVVGFAGFVYKKRQENIRRSQYGYAARSNMI